MSYLLDTNVISELIKSKPDEKVISWITSVNILHFHISVLTLGEIRKGVQKVQDVHRKQKIIRWLEIDLAKEFFGRVISIDEEVADKWGYISYESSLPAVDSLIAASALVHNHKLVTRNVKYFNRVHGLEVINPWNN